MNSFTNKILQLKINKAIKLAQQGHIDEVFDSLSPEEKNKIRNFVEKADPEQLNNVAGTVREIASKFSAEQVEEAKVMLNSMNPALAEKLEEVLK